MINDVVFICVPIMTGREFDLVEAARSRRTYQKFVYDSCVPLWKEFLAAYPEYEGIRLPILYKNPDTRPLKRLLKDFRDTKWIAPKMTAKEIREYLEGKRELSTTLTALNKAIEEIRGKVAVGKS